jgi:hypothetical protein
MTTGMCTCAAVFGEHCSCWCHTRRDRKADSIPDPLLVALAEARQRKEQAARDMRLLLAYAREITAPRPYRLADLAQAAGLSISGIRTAYTEDDVRLAIGLLGGSAQRHIDAAITTLLADRQHAAARKPDTAA